MTKNKMTVLQAVHLAKQADRLFQRAARGWPLAGCPPLPKIEPLPPLAPMPAPMPSNPENSPEAVTIRHPGL